MSCKKIKFIFILVVLFVAANFINAKPLNQDEDAISDNDQDQDLPPRDSLQLFSAVEENANSSLENGKYFQGDLDLLPQQKKYFLNNTTTRTGLYHDDFRWLKDDEGQVIVPYYLDPKSRFSKSDKAIMRIAMNDIEQNSCIRFVKRSKETDFVRFFSGDGCSSRLGKIGGMQNISLQRPECMSHGTIIHELVHALGFDHMHNHIDRNKFIIIRWDNIDEENKSQFKKVNPFWFGNFDTEYDLNSIMHYPSNAFAIDNYKDTITPKSRKFRGVIGQRKRLSLGDIKRLNNMYSCSNK